MTEFEDALAFKVTVSAIVQKTLPELLKSGLTLADAAFALGLTGSALMELAKKRGYEEKRVIEISEALMHGLYGSKVEVISTGNNQN